MVLKVFFAVVGGLLGIIAAVTAGIALIDLARFARFWLGSRGLDEAPYEDDLQKLFEKKLTPEEQAGAQGEVWSRFYGTGLSRRKLAAFRRLLDEPNTFLLGDLAWRLWWRSWRRLAVEASSADLRREALALVEREGRARLAQLSPADLDLLLSLPIEGKVGLELTWAVNNTSHRLRLGEARRRLEALAERDDDDGRTALSKAIEEALKSGEEDFALRLWERLRREDGYTRGDVEQRLRRHFSPDIDLISSLGSLRLVRLRRASGAELRLSPLLFVASDDRARQWLRQPPSPESGGRGGELDARPLPMLSLPFEGALVAFWMPKLRGNFWAQIVAKPAPSRLYTRCMGSDDLPEEIISETLTGTRLDAVLTLTEEGASLWVVDLDTKAPAADLPVTFWFYPSDGGELSSSKVRTDRDGLACLRGIRFWQLGASVQRAGDHGADEFLFLTHGQDISTVPRSVSDEDRLYFWLARPLYRPGEVLQGKLIARKKGASKPSFRWQEACSVVVEVRGPRGNTLATLDLRLSRFGSASFSVPIPADAPLGRYTFLPRSLPEGSVEGGFFVEEFVAPEFRASLRAEGTPGWGEPASLTFEASYFFGGPVADAEGILEVRRTCWSHLASQSWPPLRVHAAETVLTPLRFCTDAAGQATIELPWQGPLDLLRRYDGCDLQLKANVRDASGKTCEATMTLSQGRTTHAVRVDLEQSLRLPGEPIELSLQWHPPPGKDPVFHDLILTLYRGFSRERRRMRVSTHDARLMLPQALAPDQWNLSTRLAGQRRPTQAPRQVWVLGEGLSAHRPELRPSKTELAEGEAVQVALVGTPGVALAAVLFVNRGASLETIPLRSRSTSAFARITPPRSGEPEMHLRAWMLDARGELYSLGAQLKVPAAAPPEPPSVAVALAFPAASAPPGSVTALAASVDDASASGELACTVVDEALFSLVPAPRPPLAFFEAPPRELESSQPAWSARWLDAQTGRYAALRPYFHGPPVGGLRPQSAPAPGGMPIMPAAAAPVAAMDEADSEEAFAAPMMAASAASPQAGGGMPLVSMKEMARSAAPKQKKIDLRTRLGNGSKASEDEGGIGSGAPPEPPVAIRSDFSSEAAFVPALALAGEARVTVVLPETLTTWKATALLLTHDDRMGEGEARVTTRKELMVRLQAPRFFQERDRLTLRALVDSRAEADTELRARIEAPALSIDRAFERPLPAGGQAKLEVEVVVPPVTAPEVLVRATARAEGLPADAEERPVPFRPYGSPVRRFFQGALAGEVERVDLGLPAQRIEGRTRLTLRVDRGALDTVLNALQYLREYPYGCVEQTCSRLLPNLVWERVIGGRDDDSYRGAQDPSREAIEEGLRGLLSAQNADGGFGWWSGRSSDVWMTSYVVFCFTIAGRGGEGALAAACRFLQARILDASNADDADAFAAFALAFRGDEVERRVLDVLLPRWETLSLTEQAKLCLVLQVSRHPEARDRAARVRKKLARSARKFVKNVEGDETPEGFWFNPRTTEAIAFFVLATLRDPAAAGEHGEALDLLAAFLMLHRSGSRWHSTRDTALAALALLSLEERRAQGEGQARLRVALSGRPRCEVDLGKAREALAMTLGDGALRSGDRLELSTEGVSDAALSRRDYSVELEYFTQQDDIQPTSEGLTVERSYVLLDERGKQGRKLKSGERVAVGQRLRVALRLRAEKPRRYLLVEDFKLAGCEPVAKKSGPEVCEGACEHVELRADRTAIFLGSLGDEWAEVSYEIEAQLPGTFHAMPAQAEAMYDSRCAGSSAAFSLTVEP